MNFESEQIDDESEQDRGESEYVDNESEQADGGPEQPGDESEQADDGSEYVAGEMASDDDGDQIADAPEIVSTIARERPPRLPRAGTAFLAFLVFFVVQIGFTIIVSIVGVTIAIAVEKIDPENIKQLEAFAITFVLFFVGPLYIISGLAVYLLTRWLAADAMNDGEAVGIGWRRSSGLSLLGGFLLGVLVYGGFVALAATLFSNVKAESGGPLEEMAKQGGLLFISLAILVVICAPLVEEFLFRGVMLAGFTRSFGLPVAVFFCTALFVGVHLEQILRYWPGAIALTGLAVGAMWMRLKTKSVGPAIAAHLGYNGMAVLYGIIVSLLAGAE